MKKYSIPAINISLFDRESVVTQSIASSQAFEEAKQAVQTSGAQHSFTVELAY